MGRRHLLRRMIRRRGTAVTLKRVGAGTFDPVNSTVTGEKTTEKIENLKGIFQRFSADEIDGVEVQLEDRQLIIAGLDLREADVEPQGGDLIILADDTELRVRRVQLRNGGETYVLHLRGGRV